MRDKRQVLDVTATFRLLETLCQDARYGMRRLRRSPVFTAVAILSLALGIGANTAIFSLVYELLVRKLPVQSPNQLVELLHRYPGEPHFNGFPEQTYQLMLNRNDVFTGLIAFSEESFHVQSDTLDSQLVEGGYVDGTFFSVLGARPALGRLLGPEDNLTDHPSEVAVVSWSYWKNKLNLDPAIVGRRITVDNIPLTVIGVSARGFRGLQVESIQEIWLPLAIAPAIHNPGGSGSGGAALKLVGRLKPGVSRERAHAELAVLFESTVAEWAIATNNPFIRKMRFELEPAGAGLSDLREPWTGPLLELMAVVSLLFLIACSNVATMLLVRGAARDPEMAVRAALGARRSRLLRQAFAESILLSTAGSLVGVVLGYFGTGALVRIIAAANRARSTMEIQVRADGRTLLFAAGIALLTGVLLGLLPGVRAMRTAPMPSQAAKTGEAGSLRLYGKSLMALQVALSGVLLSTAALFAYYLSHLERIDLGFQRDHVLLVTLDPANSGYEKQRLPYAYQELLTRLEAIPGVRSATICAPSPISGAGANRGITVEGYESKPGEIRNVMVSRIGPRYFATMGTPLLAGRDFSFDDQGHPPVAIINQTLSRYYFGSDNPVGKHVTLDGNPLPYQIVGVTADSKYLEIREAPLRTIYLNTFQDARVVSQFALRTTVKPSSLALDVRRTVSDLLKTVPIERMTTLDDQVNASIFKERLIASVSSMLGAIAAILVAIGLYGLLAYIVGSRTKEIGIRMALGATRQDMARMVLADALAMVLAGLTFAAPIMWWGRRLALSVVTDLPSTTVPILLGAGAMVVVAGLAAYLPASRAARVDPMEALRYE